ncbi:MAG: hypothetical protein JXO22_03435 [Phycisphaerae bacterium]|nr:hypothetical protein [Phycisphaerae bacterium]
MDGHQTTHRLMLPCAKLALVVACCAVVWATDQAGPGERAAALLAPTLGRPVFVAPGGGFQLVAQMPGLTEPPAIVLVARQAPRHEHALVPRGDVTMALRDGGPIDVTVPINLPEQTYDLAIRGPGEPLVARHCVAVARVDQRIRLVHLSDMDIGDLTAPRLDERLIGEVNLLAPTLIVATGDYLDATHPSREAGWDALVDYFSRFDAPALMACGDHDDMTLYSQHVAPSPIGVVDLGCFRGVVLLDHPGAPLDEDAAQISWIERAMNVPNDDRLVFAVANSRLPNLLRRWRDQGQLAERVRGARLGLWLAGGHTDWDGVENRELIDAAAPLMFVGTHQSSSATREGVTGTSHYRVIDLDRGRADVLQPTHEDRQPPASLPLGSLELIWDGINDGTAERVAFTAVNRLPRRATGLAATIVLRNPKQTRPWVLGARLANLTHVGEQSVCRVVFDLPEFGSLRAVIGIGSAPRMPAVSVDVQMLASEMATIQLTNGGDEPTVVQPLVRLDGMNLPYRLAEARTGTVMAYTLRLPPGKSVTLEAEIPTEGLATGTYELQVYLRGGPAWWATSKPVEVRGPN